MFRPSLRFAAAVAITCVFTTSAYAQSVKADNVWARATVPGQKTGSIYLDLTSTSDSAVVAVASPAAARAELHSMSMEGGVMRMRALPRLELPAGKPVKLAPGAIHIMLVDLKRPLKAGDTVPLTLTVEAAGRSPATVELKVPVRGVDGAAPPHHH